MQKIELMIILGDNFVNYTNACAVFKLPLLSERCVVLCTNFALKLYQSNRSKDFFLLSEKSINTRFHKLVQKTHSNKKELLIHISVLPD